ncbi:Uu.00g061370.m01.CDS01 [Anthostomella pinea]|uniref:Uu.00g061370.m01.CDS01 n=1 Tax=Anthostomella pinea TaxID=933095 RepID=A0AAI8VSF6_9PEZI|nr:Uu.00g061370.m01.CDS01 [Anthostomella pinea]
MGLLKLENDGSIRLTKDLVNNIPPYAILSHTWGDDEDEVTFQDMTEQTGRSKRGYQKIKFCCEQAAEDDLKHSWVDTCCIDKFNSTELNEAINSMFRWYQDATRCYVYLSDVSKSVNLQVDELSRPVWKSGFRNSRWFTRGWTLQELIAPSSVEFFEFAGHHGRRPGQARVLLVVVRRRVEQTAAGVADAPLRGKYPYVGLIFTPTNNRVYHPLQRSQNDVYGVTTPNESVNYSVNRVVPSALELAFRVLWMMQM